MIAIDYQPVALVNSKGFRGLISSLLITQQIIFSETVIPDIAKKIRGNICRNTAEGRFEFHYRCVELRHNSDALLGFTAH